MGATASLSSLSLAFAISFLSFTSSTLSLSQSTSTNGFSIATFHIDSPKSPLFDPSQTDFDRARNTLQRSVHRAKFLTSQDAISVKDVITNLTFTGQYFMNMGLGTPAVQYNGIVDTNVDIIWVQCAGCTSCRNSRAAIFEPKNSSTYKLLPCNSEYCAALSTPGCSNTCKYSRTYGNGIYSRGDFASETMTLTSSTTGLPLQFNATAFGCGQEIDGMMRITGEFSGVVGLGNGINSLVQQLSPLTGSKFSYCLVTFPHYLQPNLIKFGDIGIVSGDGVVTTPLILQNGDPNYRFSLESIVIGGQKVAAPGSAAAGNVVPDTGNLITFLPRTTFNELESIVTGIVKLPPAVDLTSSNFTCYKTGFPISNVSVTFQFSGAAVELRPENIFYRVGSTTLCLAFLGYDGDVAILGSLAQPNFLVGYDLEQKTLSFKPTDCTADK